MDRFINKYQLSKTLRFGLTLKEGSINKITNLSNKNKTHSSLKELVDKSSKKIQDSCVAKLNFDEQNLVTKVSECIEKMKKYLSSWENIYQRDDQIALTKEYYQQMARKARFDYTKQKSSIVKLSTLKSEKNKIIDYWKSNINIFNTQLADFELVLAQFKHALKHSKHNKPQLVSFRKMFLSLANICNETLIHVCNQNINFPDITRLLDGENNNHLKSYCKKEIIAEHNSLLETIRELKDYFADNGGYVPFGKVTLNPYTAMQKPNNFNGEIDKKIKELKIIELIEKVVDKSEEDIIKFFEFKEDDKQKLLIDKSCSVIARAQCFKPKPIPVSVRFMLADYLAKKNGFEKDKLLKIFNLIGQPVNIGEEYIKLKDEGRESEFDLNIFPLKLAFDYAWENTARHLKNPSVCFPEVECNKLLEKFKVYKNDDSNLNEYANLLLIKDSLATLENGNNKPNNPDHYISLIKESLNEINFDSKGKKYKTNIINWIRKNDNEKRENSETFKDYQEAKKKIGVFRRELKNNVDFYKKLTKNFKEISSDFGKNFSELREKLREQYELNKINYFGVVVEDDKNDRYVLLRDLSKNMVGKDNTKLFDLLDKNNNGELKTYHVKSLTSKTLLKIIKNEKGYKTFHESKTKIDYKKVKEDYKKVKEDYKKVKEDYKKVKEDWSSPKGDTDFLSYVKDCLLNSTMAKDQEWEKFAFDFTKCNSYEDIERELDSKAHILETGKISISKLNDLFLVEKEKEKEKGWLLLPFVNQDITSSMKEMKNQFSKDWQNLFDNDIKEYRLHPEFKIVYRHSTPDYPKNKRYSRFQMIAQMFMEYVPKGDYISRKEQATFFNGKDKQYEKVEEFNEKINSNLKEDYVVFGIDRGLKQLATLCVLDCNGKIQSGFDIYTRKFDDTKGVKQWKHSFDSTRSILDLSNLRVETLACDIEGGLKRGDKVLVDLSLIKTKDKYGYYTQDNQLKIKLKQLSYIRKIQYQMQINEKNITKFFEKYLPNNFQKYKLQDNFDKLQLIINKFVKCVEPTVKTKKDKIENVLLFGETKSLDLEKVKKVFESLITPYKEGVNYANLPIEKIFDMLIRFQTAIDNNDKNATRQLFELDMAYDLKRGVVANMIGVIIYLLEKYNYNAFISMENLCNSFSHAVDGLTGGYIDKEGDFKDQENLALAGLGTYHFFEMQLLNKLFKVQKDNDVMHLVPAFRSTDNYENIVKYKKDKNNDYVNYPFGIVMFVDPRNTSKKCPVCGQIKTHVRQAKTDLLKCEECGYDSKGDNYELFKEKGKPSRNLHLITNGDDNGAYHIALKTINNLKKRKRHD